MADLVNNPITNETVYNTNPANLIRPIVEQASNYMSGLTIATTIFILGGLFLTITILYIIFKVFGQPMSVVAKEGSLIQHFDTPKSGVMKHATITGGSFRYSNLKDGTCAVTTDSVLSLEGKKSIVTFEGYGISIPIPKLAAMTKLANEDIRIVSIKDDETGEIKYKLNKNIPKETISKEAVVLSGYNFYDFNEMLKQMKNKKYIPLMIESVKNFITENMNASYIEKQIKVRQLILSKSISSGDSYGSMILYGAVGIILLMITFYMTKK